MSHRTRILMTVAAACLVTLLLVTASVFMPAAVPAWLGLGPGSREAADFAGGLAAHLSRLCYGLSQRLFAWVFFASSCVGSPIMCRLSLLAVALILAGRGWLVEQDLFGQVVSPEVHADRTVTFRLEAPQAGKVLVQGLAGMEPQALTKNANGVWEVTIGPLTAELYSYKFSVDGAELADPHNRYVKKWLTVENLVEVPGDPPLLHERQRVPHGVVHHHTYYSKTADGERGAYVYTPPDYRAGTTNRYPLLVLMHGYGDDESAWLEVGRAHWIADNLIAQGKTVPLVIVMPYGHALPWRGAVRLMTMRRSMRWRWSRTCCRTCCRCWRASTA